MRKTPTTAQGFGDYAFQSLANSTRNSDSPSERECGHRELNTALRSKIDEFGAAIAFLLLERLLKHEVGFNVDRHCIGFVSMRACCNEQVSSDKPAEAEPWSELRSPERGETRAPPG